MPHLDLETKRVYQRTWRKNRYRNNEAFREKVKALNLKRYHEKPQVKAAVIGRIAQKRVDLKILKAIAIKKPKELRFL